MIYPFRCPSCGFRREIVRHWKQAGDPLFCECGEKMERVYTVPGAIVAKSGYFDHGLGQYVGTTHDKREAIKRIGGEVTKTIRDSHGETHIVHREGPKLVEVGNEDIGGKYKPKPVVQEYTVPRGEMAGVMK